MTEGVGLIELSVLWVTFLVICGASIIDFFIDQKHGHDTLRRRKSELEASPTFPLDDIKTDYDTTVSDIRPEADPISPQDGIKTDNDTGIPDTLDVKEGVELELSKGVGNSEGNSSETI